MLELIFAAALAASPAAETAPPAAEAAVVKQDDRIVCRSVRTTGSRMADRVCRTTSDWADRSAAARRKSEEWQDEPRRPNTSMDTGSTEAGGRRARIRDRPPAQEMPTL